MPPVEDKTARGSRTSSENAVAITIKRNLFKGYTKDREVKRALMKGIQGILDLVAADKAVLCVKPEDEDADDVTIIKVVKKEDVVEGTPEAEEKPGDTQDTKDEDGVVPDGPSDVASRNDDTEAESQLEEESQKTQEMPASQGSMPYVLN